MSSTDVPPARRVFCNRTLNLGAIGAIGFDMDYTVVQYDPTAWESGAFGHAVAYLHDALGWPVDRLTFDAADVTQGLIFDLETGNILKANRFGYVKRARHGTQWLSLQQMREHYSRTVVHHEDPRFVFLNTLFSLSEATLLGHAVALWDQDRLPDVPSLTALYRHVRAAIDHAHRPDQLKATIAAAPERFVDLDPDTAPALLDLADAGKKLLLITNSDWAYTEQMMRFALDRFLPGTTTWRDLFTLVVVAARKPSFFSGDAPCFEVDTSTGWLRPLDGPMQPGRVYHGGHAALVERALGLASDQLLYLGDHFFGDVHASKSALRWRTALVMRELEDEIEAAVAFAPTEQELVARMADKERLEDALNQARLELLRVRAGRAEGSEDAVGARIDGLRRELAALDALVAPLARASAERGGSVWGPILRTGGDKSYLAYLLERHADIYTSRVSNLLHATPFRFFRSVKGTLPHDAVTRDVEGA